MIAYAGICKMEQGIPPDEPIEHVKPQYVYIYNLYILFYINFINIYHLIIIINVCICKIWNKEFFLDLSMFIYLYIYIYISLY